MSNKSLKQLGSMSIVILREDMFLGGEKERTFIVAHQSFKRLHGLLDGKVYSVSYNDVERIERV